MDPTSLHDALQREVPGVSIEPVPSVDSHATLFVPRDEVTTVLRAMRDRLGYTFLAELTAVDFWPRDPRFELVYVLVAPELRQRARLKVKLAGGDAHVVTSSALWPAANWLEREVADLFGITFDGHPDPRRLLMPEDWEGYPLRKDYPVQIQMKPRISEPTQITAEEFRANVERDRRART